MNAMTVWVGGCGRPDRAADGQILDAVRFGWDGEELVLQSNTAHTARAGVAAGGSTTWVWTYHPDGGEVLSQHTEHHTPPASTGAEVPPGDGGSAGRHRRSDWPQSEVDTEFYAIVADLAGAPTELVDPVTGEVAGRVRRSVWGHTRWDGASTPLGFAGQQHDPETGLHYNRFRYYNPATTTYTSPDPLGVGPNPASATAYVHNPYTWVDPLGLKFHLKRKRTDGYRGGRYKDLDSDGGKLDRHHMPAKNGRRDDNGPAIQMERLDHRDTASYGRSSAATSYREAQQNLIAAG